MRKNLQPACTNQMPTTPASKCTGLHCISRPLAKQTLYGNEERLLMLANTPIVIVSNDCRRLLLLAFACALFMCFDLALLGLFLGFSLTHSLVTCITLPAAWGSAYRRCLFMSTTPRSAWQAYARTPITALRSPHSGRHQWSYGASWHLHRLACISQTLYNDHEALWSKHPSIRAHSKPIFLTMFHPRKLFLRLIGDTCIQDLLRAPEPKDLPWACPSPERAWSIANRLYH